MEPALLFGVIFLSVLVLCGYLLAGYWFFYQLLELNEPVALIFIVFWVAVGIFLVTVAVGGP